MFHGSADVLLVMFSSFSMGNSFNQICNQEVTIIVSKSEKDEVYLFILGLSEYKQTS